MKASTTFFAGGLVAKLRTAFGDQSYDPNFERGKRVAGLAKSFPETRKKSIASNTPAVVERIIIFHRSRGRADRINLANHVCRRAAVVSTVRARIGVFSPIPGSTETVPFLQTGVR